MGGHDRVVPQVPGLAFPLVGTQTLARKLRFRAGSAAVHNAPEGLGELTGETGYVRVVVEVAPDENWTALRFRRRA